MQRYYAGRLVQAKVAVELRGSSIVNTVGYIPLDRLDEHRNSDGYIINANGMASSVVRQYERFPALLSFEQDIQSEKPPWRWVLAFSMYGALARYTDGALDNAFLMPRFYPGWEMWIYHDESVPVALLRTLANLPYVHLVNMQDQPLRSRMSWRFLVASESTIARYAIRDIDSRISAREAAAVAEWVASGERFHLMRDHPSHSNFAMSGGLWGGTHDSVPQMAYLLSAQTMNDNYLSDMDFLNAMVWPLARQSVMQHDAFSCSKFGGGTGFPLPRVGWEHVGGVYIDRTLREGDVDLLRKATPPTACTRPAPPLRAMAAGLQSINSRQELLHGRQQMCNGIKALLDAVDQLPEHIWYAANGGTMMAIKRYGDCIVNLGTDVAIDRRQVDDVVAFFEGYLAKYPRLPVRLLQYSKQSPGTGTPKDIHGLPTQDSWYKGKSDVSHGEIAPKAIPVSHLLFYP